MTQADVKFSGDPISVPIDALTIVELPPRVFRGRLSGMLFDTDKAFLLPSAMHGIRGLKRYYDQHPGLSVLVTGHTDTVGASSYNEALSNERAEAVAAYLVEDVETWFAHYSGSPHSRKWGTTEDQHMLSALPQEGPPHYAGPIHGIVDAPTRAAIESFQRSVGLSDDGVAGPDTRRALIGEYMALDETTLPPEATLETHGCGEHHLTTLTPDDTDEPSNRRVEIFLFEGPVDPPPRNPCGNCPEYPQWLARLVETVDFTVDPGWLDVAVTDADGVAVAGAAVRIEGPTSDQAETAATGLVRFLELPVGAYEVVVVADGFEDIVFPVAVIPGEPPPPPTSLPPPPPAANGQQLAFAGDGAPSSGTSSGGGGSTGGQTGPNAGSAKLGSTDTIIHIVDEIPEGAAPPGLRDRVKEGKKTPNHGAWSRVSVFCSWNGGSTHVVKKVDKNGKATIKLDKSQQTSGTAPVEKGVLNIVLVDPPGAGTNAQIFTLRDPDDPKKILFDPPIQAGQTTRVKISTRLRASLWASTNNLNAANLAKLSAGKVDDLSFLSTVTNMTFKDGDDPMTLAVEWDPSFRTGANSNPAGEVAFYSGLISTCHGKGVQALVGFQHALNAVGGRASDFHRWMIAVNGLPAAGQDAAITGFAGRLVDFVAANLPAFDGISFDIEHIPPNMSIADQASFFTHFYRAVATRLAANQKIVAIAVGEFDNQAVSVAITDLQERFDHTSTMKFARVHPYQLALGFPNIILRPMAFGSLSAQTGPAAQKKWHEDIVEYAIGTVKLPPEQFQLGVFLGSAAGQVSLQFGDTLERRCTDLLRPDRVGLCGFALGANHDWNATAKIDKFLNDGEKPPNTPGQPFQAPIRFDPQTL